jgi:hypothetical protein
MKHAYSFLAGVALVSLCVFFTNSLPGYMFGLGFGICLGSILMLHFKGILRLVPYWSNGTLGNRSSSATGEASRRTRVKPVTNDDLANRYERIPKKRKRQMGLDMWAAAFESSKRADAGKERVQIPDDAELFGEPECTV